MTAGNGKIDSRVLTAGYTPRVFGPSVHQFRKQGPWTWEKVEEMRTDPQVQFGLWVLSAPVANARWEVKARDERVAAFVDSQIKRVWQHDLPKILDGMFCYGSAGGEVVHFENGDTGWWEVDGLRDIHLMDLRLKQSAGKITRVVVQSVKGTSEGVSLYAPRYWWVAEGARFGAHYGKSRLYNAWEPYWEKRGPKGAIDSRRQWFFKWAYQGGTMRHPDGYEDLGNGSVKSYQDTARQLVELFEAGGIFIFSNAKDPETGEFLWSYEHAKMADGAADIREYPKDLDEEILTALGIPGEIVKAASTGSGWSGRRVPFLTFLVSLDKVVDAILQAVERQVLRPLVDINFGEGVGFKIEPVSLVQLLNEGGQGNPPGGQQPPGQPQEGGAGGGEGWQPYQGPRGGVNVQGKFYPGGEFIPSEVMEKATLEEKTKVEGDRAGAVPKGKADVLARRGDGLPDPGKLSAQIHIARSLRKSMLRATRRNPKDQCINAAHALNAVYPEAEIWSGNYDGEYHTVARLGGRYIDVTADQFGGPEVVVRKELPGKHEGGSYRNFRNIGPGGADTELVKRMADDLRRRLMASIGNDEMAEATAARLSLEERSSCPVSGSAVPAVDAIIDRGVAAGVVISEEVRAKVRAAVARARLIHRPESRAEAEETGQ